MQELRLIAVSEDGSYAVLAVPGRSRRFSLPIDDRLRTVARGQFSRLAQYDIEVESPLRPKEIQDRIRAGETADEIADAAGVPIERVRRFEGPVLAEREYRAQEAQRSTIRNQGDSAQGPRLADVVSQRLADAGAAVDEARWDSRKRSDGNWQVQLRFSIAGRPQLAEWVYDPRRRHVAAADDQARRLCLPEAEWAAVRFAGRSQVTATVTPIGSRLGQAAQHPETGAGTDRGPARAAAGTTHAPAAAGSGAAADREPASPAAAVSGPPGVMAHGAQDDFPDAPEVAEARAHPMRKAASGRARRSSVPSWDEIMFGTSRHSD